MGTKVVLNDGGVGEYIAASSTRSYLGKPTALSALSTSTKKMRVKKKVARKNKQLARRKR